MDLSNRVLGSYLASQMRTRAASVLLQIGRDGFTRPQLSRVQCFNFQAAATLSAAVAALRVGPSQRPVRDARDLFEHVPPDLLAVPRVGAVAIAVLGAAFEARGIGGDTPLETWVRRHTEHGKVEEIITFGAMKRSDERDAERKRTADRKHARRDQAHRLRVTRFTERRKAS
jgi:hypothetical protein